MKTANNGFIKTLRYVLLVIVIVSGFISIIGSGAKYVWRSDPWVQKTDNKYFVATIYPSCEPGYRPEGGDFLGGCQSLLLKIDNKTNKDIEIIWDKTYYIENGRTNGGFMFEGVVYRERNNPKPPDIVFANSSFSKTIWPCNLVTFSKGWYNLSMPQGENGIFLTIAIDGREIREKITINLSSTSGS